MDVVPAPATPPLPSADAERIARNSASWASWSGYETSSGCPCWDASRYICIPKRSGFGFNPNLYACLCCCLCDSGAPQAN